MRQGVWGAVIHAEEVNRSFSRASRSYELCAAAQAQVAEDLLFQLGVYPPEMRVLEVGAGSGMLTAGLCRMFGVDQVTALDSSGAMLERLAERLSGVRIVQSRIEEYRPEERFDLAVSSSALHWTDLAESMTALRAVLADSGEVCAAVMVRGTLAELRAIRSRLYPELAPASDLPTESEVLSAVRRAGFDLKWSVSKTYTERYQNAWELLRSLHASGVTGGKFSRAKRRLLRTELDAIANEYHLSAFEAGRGLPANYEVVFFRAWK